MNRSAITAAAILFCAAPAAVLAAPTTYDGILFPEGDISFADVVVTSDLGPNTTGEYADVSDVLGAPDAGANGAGSTSLGVGGSITVRFTDNALTASGDAAADLHVFEIGGQVEAFSVEISVDGLAWIALGTLSGQPTSIDIDAVAGVTPGTKYYFVRVTDDPNSGGTAAPYAGADIDAIGAISTVEAAVPLPAAAPLLLGALGGLAALRRRG